MFNTVKYVERDKILNIWALEEILNERLLLGTSSDANSIRYICTSWYLLLGSINKA